MHIKDGEEKKNWHQKAYWAKHIIFSDLTGLLPWHFFTWAHLISLPSSFFQPVFDDSKTVGHSCKQTLPRSLYALPFPLYCQPAYPPLMELLKSRYEQNLGEAAFVGACVPIRWERSDKNRSNACRSCHSMHNNPCGCRKRNKVWQQRERERACFPWWIYVLDLRVFLWGGCKSD